MGAINFQSHKTPFRLKDQLRYQLWVERIVNSNHKFPSEIQYIFCTDAFLADLNKQYLDHDSFTDILTFNYNVGHYISGDIFISIDRVKENATKFETDFEKELQRVMIHGVLHLLGFNDKSPAEKARMHKKENEALAFLPNI